MLMYSIVCSPRRGLCKLRRERMSRQEQYEEYEPAKGLWGRVKDRVFGPDEAEFDEETEGHTPEARKRAAIRLESSRGIRVAVRQNAIAFNDARSAADGLKNGQQQIVNLER